MRSDTIPLGLWNLYAGEYVLRVGLEAVDAVREVWLYDRGTGRSVRVMGNGLDHAFVQAAGQVRKEGLALVVHSRVPVAREDGPGRLLLYPNPSGTDRVRFAVPMQGLTPEGGRLPSMVDVVDARGVMLLKQAVLLDGRGRGELEVMGLQTGTYVLRVRVGGREFIQKMVRQ